MPESDHQIAPLIETPGDILIRKLVIFGTFFYLQDICETSCNNGRSTDTPFLTSIPFRDHQKMGYLMSYVSLKSETVGGKKVEKFLFGKIACWTKFYLVL